MVFTSIEHQPNCDWQTKTIKLKAKEKWCGPFVSQQSLKIKIREKSNYWPVKNNTVTQQIPQYIHFKNASNKFSYIQETKLICTAVCEKFINIY